MNVAASPTPVPTRPLVAPNTGLAPRRKLANALMWIGAVTATTLAIIPLALVLYYVTIQGVKVLGTGFFTQVQPPPMSDGGGMKHSIAGTLMLIGLASLIGLPFGVLGGIYLAEFGNNKLGWWIRFSADVLNGVPSIVIGIFVYAIAVLPLKSAPLFGLCWRPCAGLDDDSDRDAHDRRNRAFGAGFVARCFAGTGRDALAARCSKSS